MTKRLAFLFIAVLFVLASCGSDEPSVVAGAADGTSDNETPMPTEPDGGIGDGATPPFAEDAPEEGDWHGAQLAETNCPGTDWRRVESSSFSFSVPVDLVDDEVMGIDSEVGQWSRAGMLVSFDYGWYSNPLDQVDVPTEVSDIDFSGISGRQIVGSGGGVYGEGGFVGVHFPEVTREFDQSDRLTLVTSYDDPADEIIGRCIVGSIEWNLEAS